MKKVLIVDDDPLVIFGLARALRSLCDVVNYAAYAKSAIGRMQANFYDLCFLDVNLPDANGIELMDTIREISPETKIVIMTASQVEPEMKKQITEKAFHFIEKPFDLIQILDIVNQALDVGEENNLL